MNIVIIDYGSGNLRSAAKAFERAASEVSSKVRVNVTSDPRLLINASHIVLPGVGAFADCLSGLNALNGMLDALEKSIKNDGKAFLGICVGMQLMARVGKEYGEHEGLGWINSEVIPINPSNSQLKVPHMGWNDLKINMPHPCLSGILTGDHTYFVHGYHMRCNNEKEVMATVDYGEPVTAVVARDNILGTQFHPEKSQSTGLLFIKNFINWQP